MSSEAKDLISYLEEAGDTEVARAVIYMGFGLKLADLLDGLRALRDDPYSTDEAGRLDYADDLQSLITQADLLYREFLNNKNKWGRK